MSPNKEPFEWAALAEQSAERARFRPVRCPMEGQAFSLGGEVSPSVQIFFRRVTFAEIAPEIFFGVHAEPFELEWHERLLRTGLAPELESPALGLHAANVAGLRPRPWSAISPSDEDVALVREWLDRAFEYAKRLPSSVTSLVASIEANRIVDHSVEAYVGHPVKVRGFADWLRRVHGVEVGERLFPLLSDRTEPYDLDIMLGSHSTR
jgi:hypothetical protein